MKTDKIITMVIFSLFLSIGTGFSQNYTRSFLEQQSLHNTTVGGEPVLLVWYPEYETLGVFSRKINNDVIEVTNIDVHGVTNEGKLERLPQYPHVFWMIWSHWYPGTSINS